MSKKLTSLVLRSVIGAVIFFVVVFLAGVAAGALAARGVISKDQAMTWAVAAIGVIAMTGAMVVSVAWMRAIDEAAREAHKAAWFWGGCGGMSLGGVALIMTSLPQSAEWSLPSFDGRTDPAAYAATGAFGMMLLMVAGYSVVWAWWWLTRMRS